MVSYRVLIEREAQRYLRKADPMVRRRLMAAIDALATEPRPSGCKPLTGYSGTYRLRVGAYRVLYEVVDAELVIYIIEVGPRGDIYK